MSMLTDAKTLAERLAALVRSFAERRVLVRGRPGGGPVRVRRDQPRVARGAGAHPAARADGDGAGRRGELRGEPRVARRARRHRRRGRRGRGRARAARAGSTRRASIAAASSSARGCRRRRRCASSPGHAHSTRQQVIRIDYEGGALDDASRRAALAENLRARVAAAEAVVVSDYNYGVAGGEVDRRVARSGERRASPCSSIRASA